MEPEPYRSPATPDSPVIVSEVRGGNIGLAILAGLVAALVCAMLWALLVSATNFKIGFAAVGVGYLVGLTVRSAGHGSTPAFGYVGAVMALLGCVVGDILTDCVFVAHGMNRPVLDIVTSLTPDKAWTLLQLGFQPLDALFYFLAVSAGYRNSFTR